MITAHPRRIRNSLNANLGVLIQLAGLAALFLIPAPFNFLLGVGGIIVGGLFARSYNCSACGAPIKKRTAVCPRCNSSFRA
jgi:hypothetical protein